MQGNPESIEFLHSHENEEVDPARAAEAARWQAAMADELIEDSSDNEPTMVDLFSSAMAGPLGDIGSNMQNPEFFSGASPEAQEDSLAERTEQLDPSEIDANNEITQESFDYWRAQVQRQFATSSALEKVTLVAKTDPEHVLAVFTRDNIDNITRETAAAEHQGMAIVENTPTEDTDMDMSLVSSQKNRDDLLNSTIDNPQYSDNKINHVEEQDPYNISSNMLGRDINQTPDSKVFDVAMAYESMRNNYTTNEIVQSTEHTMANIDDKDLRASGVSSVSLNQDARDDQKTIIENANNAAFQLAMQANAELERGDYTKAAEIADQANGLADEALTATDRITTEPDGDNDLLAGSSDLAQRQSRQTAMGIIENATEVSRIADEAAAAEAAGDEARAQEIASQNKEDAPADETERVIEVDTAADGQTSDTSAQSAPAETAPADPFSMSQDQYQAMIDQRNAAARQHAADEQAAYSNAVNPPESLPQTPGAIHS